MAYRETGLPSSRACARWSGRAHGSTAPGGDRGARGIMAPPTLDGEQHSLEVRPAGWAVVVFGPNNFPLASTRSPEATRRRRWRGQYPDRKANTGIPARPCLTEAAFEAVQARASPGDGATALSNSHASGDRLVSHPRVGALGFGQSRGGVAAHGAADAAGKPI